MDDQLKKIMMERVVPTAPTGLPAPPPAPASHVKPAEDRYRTGMKMQHAYANGWNPNPMLIRVLEGK